MRRSTLALILLTLPACGRASKEATPASAPPAAQEAMRLSARDEEESDNKELARPKSAPAPGRRAGLALSAAALPDPAPPARRRRSAAKTGCCAAASTNPARS